MRRPEHRQRRFRLARRGTALIETLIALVVLAFAGAGMISLLAQTLARLHDLHARERDIDTAARMLEATLALSRTQLRARIGVTREPTVWLDVDQPSASLFDVVVRDTLTRTELLHTTVFRPDTVP